jgi:hypothetical protein
MASLGVFGDPDSWLNAGGTMGSAVQRVQDEIDAADGSGGSGLRPHWYGPVGDTYQDVWQRRYRRYDDLVGQAKPAVTAISNFGQRMIDFQRTAVKLESKWLECGLVLTADGLRFTLPASHASLPHELKLTFESLLGASERDIEEMWNDIDGAVQDLVSVLSSAAGSLEDFAFLEAAGIGWAASIVLPEAYGLVKSFLSEHWTDVVLGVLGEEIVPALKEGAEKDLAEVEDLSKVTYHHGDAFVRSNLRDMKDGALGEVKAAGTADKLVKFGGRAATAIAVVGTGVSTYIDVRREGVEAGIESNAGAWAGLAVSTVGMGLAETGVGLVVAAAGIAVAPVAVTVGAVVVLAAASAGVGWLVQHEVNAHQVGLNQAVAATGQAAVAMGDDAKSSVNIGLKDLRNFV